MFTIQSVVNTGKDQPLNKIDNQELRLNALDALPRWQFEEYGTTSKDDEKYNIYLALEHYSKVRERLSLLSQDEQNALICAAKFFSLHPESKRMFYGFFSLSLHHKLKPNFNIENLNVDGFLLPLLKNHKQLKNKVYLGESSIDFLRHQDIVTSEAQECLDKLSLFALGNPIKNKGELGVNYINTAVSSLLDILYLRIDINENQLFHPSYLQPFFPTSKVLSIIPPMGLSFLDLTCFNSPIILIKNLFDIKITGVSPSCMVLRCCCGCFTDLSHMKSIEILDVRGNNKVIIEGESSSLKFILTSPKAHLEIKNKTMRARIKKQQLIIEELGQDKDSRAGSDVITCEIYEKFLNTRIL